MFVVIIIDVKGKWALWWKKSKGNIDGFGLPKFALIDISYIRLFFTLLKESDFYCDTKV